MPPTWLKVATCTAVVLLVLVVGHFAHYVKAEAHVGEFERCNANTVYQSSGSALQQAQQVKSQQILLSVLKNITAGSISASTALKILQDVALLRSSLKDGAAADRWATLKSKSAQAQQLLDPQQQQQRQTQQQPDQQVGAAVPPGTLAKPARQQQQEQKSRRRHTRGSGNSWSRSNSPRASRGSKDASAVEQPAQRNQQQHNPTAATAATKEQVEARPAAPSRGLLIVAGGPHQFQNAFILLQLLRHAKISCMLPVEVVHYGPSELAPAVAAAMQKHAAATNTSLKIIDGLTAAAVDMPPHQPLRTVTGFKTKVHALAFVTSFDHVLLLDSDNTPLADPTYLFDSAAFRRTGNLFWLDFWTDQWMDGLIYKVLGLDVPWEASSRFRASEAGQLVLDRLRHYDVLEWLWLLNLHSGSGQAAGDGGLVGKCLWGDKDTYRIAFQLAGKEDIFYSIEYHPLQALARPDGSMFLHAGMVQRGLFGELLFLHRTAAGKMWPHCANSQGQSCIIWGVTTPVDQEQLLASVLDPTNMRFQPSKLDLKWQDKHCFRGAAASSASWVGGRRRWSAEDGQWKVGNNVPDNGDGSFGADRGDASFVEKEAAGFWRVDAADGFASVGVQAVGSADVRVVQQPLLLSVADVGDVQHMHAAAAAAAVRTATILDCELDKAQHLLPIPAIAATKLPEQVQGTLDVAFEMFYSSAIPTTPN